ncbi:DUF928 domain-containing protein [Coleofasciculus sp. E1-EBD-02]|uniref:DUF928 domain-containing protein n=1 Tax=Coleofasciculus sp. E1-EBD-02 TaxID=3068481 RepID=UPI0032FF0971
MTKQTYSLLLATTSLVCSLSLVSFSRYATPVLAESQPVNLLASNVLSGSLKFDFRSPRTEGEPKESGTIGTRGGCSTDESLSPSLTPLTPNTVQGLTENQDTVDEYPTLTVSDHPSFFVYVPKTSATTGEFILTNQQGTQEIHYALVTLPETPGIISVKLPTNLDPLEIGQVYQWSFSLKCHDSDATGNPTVLGWIERTEPNPALEKDLDKVKPLELAALYGNYGVWHDLLATLVELRLSHPEDSNLTMMWENMLKSESVKLEEISQAPLVESTPVEY